MGESSRPPVRRTYGRRVAPSSPVRHSMLFTPPPSSPSSAHLYESQSSEGLSSPTRAPKRGILDSDPIDLPSPKRARPLSTRDSNVPEPDTACNGKNADKAKETKQATLAAFFGPIQRRKAAAAVSKPNSSASPPPPSSATTSTADGKPKKLTQLHFMNGAQRSCAECGMSYMRGGEDDRTHASHHMRVTRGIPWPKSRSGTNVGSVTWKGGSARLVVVDGTGKWDEVYATVDAVLSASPLTPRMREHCKLILAITSCAPPKGKTKRWTKEDARERIVGVVVAQPIKHAMRVLGGDEDIDGKVESGGGVMCDPTPLPTPLGIHRLFVVPAYRGCGLARAMLDAAASNTVYGCSFDPVVGEVAFSQPTDSGRAVMLACGKGGVRVFDEGQL